MSLKDLTNAIKRGNTERVRTILQGDIDISQARIGDSPILFTAIYAGNVDIIKLLVEKGADVNAVNNTGSTVLAINIRINRDPELVRFLIEKGADVNAKSSNGSTPLSIAVTEGFDDIAKLLIEKGADVNAVNNTGNTLLHLVADAITRLPYNELEKTNIIKILVENGVDVAAKNAEGGIALSYLSESYKKKRFDIVKLLTPHYTPTIEELNDAIIRGEKEKAISLVTSNNFDLNKPDFYGRIPLMLAAINLQDIEFLKLLLSKGADINATDKKENSALISSILVKDTNLEVVEFLIENGADVNAENDDGETPLHVAIGTENVELVKRLLDAPNIDIEAKDKIEETPLFTAVGYGNIEIVNLLLEKGADIKVVDDEGYTVLHSAVERGNLDIAKLLIEKGVDINLVVGSAPLHIAIDNENVDMVKLLLENGADINLQDEAGQTPLQLAFENRNNKVIDLLIEKGADINTTDSEGKSPLIYAINADDYAKVKSFISKGAKIDNKDNEGKNALTASILITNKKPNTVHFITNYLISISDPEALNSVDKNGNSPLVYAFNTNNFDVFRLLVRKGADPNTKIFDSESLLQIIYEFGNDEVEKYCTFLIERGADPRILEPSLIQIFENGQYKLVKALLDKDVDPTPLLESDKMTINTAAIIGNINLVDKLLEIKDPSGIPKFDVNFVDTNGNNALIAAIRDKHIDLANYLLDKNADVNIEQSGGWSVLLQAALQQNVDLFRRILNLTKPEILNSNKDNSILFRCAKDGYTMEEFLRIILEERPDVNINIRNSKDTGLLDYAIALENTRVAKLLIERPEIDLTHANTKLSLFLAVNRQQLTTVKHLLKKGIDVNLQNSKGKTAMDLALDDEMRDLLQQNYELLPWKGYPKDEIEFFESLFESPESAKNISMCPICLTKVERSEACMYMKHSCPLPADFFTLYQKFKFGEASLVSWCTLCGRSCANHHHFEETLMEEAAARNAKLPLLSPLERGAGPFDNDCKNQGGGGFREKITRIVRLAECACKLQSEIDKMTNWEARRLLITAAWDGPIVFPLTDDEYDTILETKKFPFPRDCVLPGTVTPVEGEYVYFSSEGSVPKDFELPANKKAERVPLVFEQNSEIPASCDLNNPANPDCGGVPPQVQDTCFMGEHDDGRKVYGFRHKNRDNIEHGCVINDFCEWGERVCAEHLEEILRNIPIDSVNKGKCPITADCKEKLYPEEIKGIVSDAVYEDYKAKFNKVNTGYIRRGGRKITRKRKRKIVGGDEPKVVVEHIAETQAEHTSEDIPNLVIAKKDGGKRRKTYRKKKLNRKHTSKK